MIKVLFSAANDSDRHYEWQVYLFGVLVFQRLRASNSHLLREVAYQKAASASKAGA